MPSRLLLLVWLAVSAVAALAQEAETPEYAGSDTCGACHEEIQQSFARNPHRALADIEKGRWRDQECEACHGAGMQHAESADAAAILGFKTTLAAQANRACLGCHAGQDTQLGRLFGSHDRNNLACTGCHSVHAAAEPRLLTAKSDALCSGCHIAERAQFRRPFRHKLDEGAIRCVQCHNPHGNPPPASLHRVSGNEATCLKCHADKRGPFPFEHAPVKLEPCSTCHEPHGSANPRMLVRHDQSQLCLECHTSTFARLGGSPPAFHDLRSARFRNCTICHSKIHGSYVNRDLLR